MCGIARSNAFLLITHMLAHGLSFTFGDTRSASNNSQTSTKLEEENHVKSEIVSITPPVDQTGRSFGCRRNAGGLRWRCAGGNKRP
jgi:hypothetical protein